LLGMKSAPAIGIREADGCLADEADGSPPRSGRTAATAAGLFLLLVDDQVTDGCAAVNR